MELVAFREAASCAATQELPNILCNRKGQCLVHNSSPLVPILNRINLVQTTPSYLSSTYVFVFLVVSFLLAFPSKSYMHSSSPNSLSMS
jgi:hypothetical protein